ncbi:TIGR02996 domain-containing protein [Thalassoroseus pseudoceratinae]|uniref:TIGR02996 domain-containing protein n=1 Tax=Thalassoroseus pseudoceratinae TaxID=2713176 RepID=UPI00142008C5|nr:TIGR02996 domain-containing protein [Thalassoroseus pseudoceratinae]
MQTNEQFLHAIVEDPDNDLPRLVYADWLDEQGDPRGEFIRVQCELAKLDEFDPDRIPLEERQDTLLKKHKTKWSKDLKVAAIRVFEFRRGFVEAVTLNVKNHLQNAEALLDTVPTIRKVKVNALKAVVPEFITSKWLERIDSLNLAGNKLGLRRMRTLLESPHFTEIRELDLTSNNILAGGFQAFVDSGKFPKLTKLICNNSEAAEPSKLSKIGCGPLWKQLESVELAEHAWEDDAIQTLAESWPVCGWKHLNLSFNAFAERGFQALLENGHLTSLESLSLKRCYRLPDSAIAMLANADALGTLRSLDIRGCNYIEDGLNAVLNSQSLVELRKLYISSALFPEFYLPIVAHSTGLPNLETLYLSINPIQSSDLASLRQPNRLQQLKTLVILAGTMDDDVLAELRELLPDVKIFIYSPY